MTKVTTSGKELKNSNRISHIYIYNVYQKIVCLLRDIVRFSTRITIKLIIYIVYKLGIWIDFLPECSASFVMIYSDTVIPWR